MNLKKFQQKFFERLDSGRGLSILFDYLPQIYLFVKNQHSQFVQANKTFLELLGKSEEHEVLGRTDRDFFVPAVAEMYINEDRQVMATGKPFVNKVWLVPDSQGVLKWYLCTKIPLFDHHRRIIGIAGTLIDYHLAGAVLDPYSQMAEIIRYLNDHYAEELSIVKLAQLAHLSVSQFERRFKQLFQMTPLKYLIKIRIDVACKWLSQSNMSITQIAMETGFYDHSCFTKKFKALLRVTPSQYRREYFKE